MVTGAENSVKQTVFDLIPPAMVAAVVLFWAFGPTAWINNSWSIVIVGGLITASVQLLEFIHERHAGWRITTKEFATDLFYVLLGYTAISWASNLLAEEPLKAVKQSLGINTAWAMQMPFVLQVALVVFLVEL